MNYKRPMEISSKIVIIGPCTLEGREQMLPLWDFAKKWKFSYMRTPLFKPRTHPDSFQGLGEAGLPLVVETIERGLSPVIEVMSLKQLLIVAPFVHIIQIGARNMQNFELLKEIGPLYLTHCPHRPFVMLKRGFSNTTEEWMNSALYLEQAGIPQDKILLCERGIRSAASPKNVVLDLNSALDMKLNSPYKVLIDPSHGSKRSDLVLPLLKGALAMGFDGVMVETHPSPEKSVSDAEQAISPEMFEEFFAKDHI